MQQELFKHKESSIKCFTVDGKRRLEAQFMSERIDWATPQNLFNKLDKEFNFTLDPCASESNAKCKKFYTIKENGLAQDWTGERVFMNPPYGKEITKWIRKAYFEAKEGAEVVVCLIPCRTDTKWWHSYVMKARQIRFIKGRLSFDDNRGRAPFPSAVIIF